MTSDDDALDYKFITKFLDNSKSFEENYQIAFHNKYKKLPQNKAKQIVKILLENNVIYLDKPKYLLNEIIIRARELAEVKNYSYDKFINHVLQEINNYLLEEGE